MNKPLKILHLFNEYLPETEAWAYDLISNLPNCENHIAARTYLKNDFYSSTFKYVEHSYGEKLAASFKWRKNNAADLIRKIGFKLESWINGDERKIIKSYIKSHNPDLIHCHFGQVAAHNLPILKRIDIPVVVSFYGLDYEYLPNKIPKLKEQYKEVFKLASMIFTEGEFSRKKLIQMGADPERVKIARLGIKLGENTSLPSRSKHFKLSQIASFTEKKGQLDAIKAVEMTLKTYPNLQLDLYGNIRDTEYYLLCKNYIESNSLKDNIRIKDFISYENLDQSLKSYHGFIHPSKYSKDRNCEGGAPTILFHALAAGVPVISTDHCDIPEIVVSDKCGFLSAEGNIEELSNSIIKLIELKDGSYASFQDFGRKQIEAHYDIRKNACLIEKYYRQCL